MGEVSFTFCLIYPTNEPSEHEVGWPQSKDANFAPLPPPPQKKSILPLPQAEQ